MFYRFDLSTIVHATGTNKAHLKDIRNKVDRFDNDPDKERRLEKGECKFCYYVRSKIGGAAMTTKPCNACEVPVMYSSTCTGSVCKECSKKYRVCTYCGGDINGKNRRKL
jgi:hypothetical protein